MSPFMRCFIKGWDTLSLVDDIDLSKRRRSLNDEFVFTEQIIGKLLQLNERLKKEELRIKPFWEKLVANLEQQVKDKVIDDYNFNSELAFFSDDKFYKRLYQHFEGNPICVDPTYYCFGHIGTKIWKNCIMGIIMSFHKTIRWVKFPFVIPCTA